MAGFKESVKPAVFDGTNWLDTPILNLPATMSEFSLSVRVFMVDDEIRQDLLGILGTFIIRVTTQYIGVLWWNASGLIFHSTPSPIAGAEAFITATYKQGDALRIYLNGVEIYSTSDSVSTPLEYIPGEILRVGNAVDRVVAGTEISSAEAYTQALTPEDIKALYNRGVGLPAKLLKTYGLDSGLLAGYDLHGENPLVDLSGNGNHLANVNNVTFDGDAVDVVYQPLQTVVGAEFDGGNRLSSPALLGVAPRAFTLSVVFSPPISNATTQSLMAGLGTNGDVYRMRYSTSGKIDFTLFNSVRNSTLISSTESFSGVSDPVMVSIVIDLDAPPSEVKKLYINGILDVQETLEMPAGIDLENNDLGTSIGSRGASELFTGNIHSSSILLSALSPEDIKALYNRGVGVDLKKLPSRLKDSAVGVYPLDDLLDYSGNGNDLINVNNVALTATKQGQRLLDKPPTELVLTGNMAYMPASSASTIELATADRYTAEGTEWTASCFIDTLSPLRSRIGVFRFRNNSSYYVNIYSDGDLRINLPAPAGLVTINMLVSEYDGVNHLCITSGAEGLQVYWSGSLIYSDPAGAVEMPNPTSTIYTNWGRSGSTSNDRMDGSLASCAFFLSEASAEDIEDLANNVAYESLRTDFKATCKEFITLTEDVPSTGLQHTNLVTGNVVDKAQHSGFTVPTIDYRIKL